MKKKTNGMVRFSSEKPIRRLHLIQCMLAACKGLKRFEESIGYEKEMIKIMVRSYNSGESIWKDETPVKQIHLLLCYKELIDSQIRCKYFEGALKSFKKIKLFKLDSMNPDDVEKSMGPYIWEELENLKVIAALCKLKSQAFHGLGYKKNCQLWSKLAMQICVNMQKLVKGSEKSLVSKGQKGHSVFFLDEFTIHLVNTTLNIAELDLSQRPSLFNELVCYLFCETKHASFYIENSLKERSSYRYGELKIDAVIPFIEHFLKCCTKEFLCKAKKYLENVQMYPKKIDPNISLESQRKQMITYRNSLLIMKHFNSLP